MRGNFDLTGYCLLLEDPTGQFYKVAGNEVKDLQTGAIMIIRHVPIDDFALERVVLAESLELCREVGARMLDDQELAINSTDKPRFLRGLQRQRFSVPESCRHLRSLLWLSPGIPVPGHRVSPDQSCKVDQPLNQKPNHIQMKNLITLLLLLGLALFVQSCNLSKTAVVRDTVKAVATTTPDFFSFYVEEFGEGKLKDYNRTVAQNSDNPDMIIRMIPGEKQDLGYFLIKPASPSGADALSPGPGNPGEISIPLGKLRPILIPQRGN
jgi:hypothetical protein